jgi:hypothetical protein
LLGEYSGTEERGGTTIESAPEMLSNRASMSFLMAT